MCHEQTTENEENINPVDTQYVPEEVDEWLIAFVSVGEKERV